MLHANFQILVNFIEFEEPFEHVDVDHNKEVWDEVRLLYEWWTLVRPARTYPIDEIPVDLLDISSIPPDFLIENIAREQEYWEEDQKMLHRLIEVRGHLWT